MRLEVPIFFFSSFTSSSCVSSSRPTSSQALARRSLIRNSCFNFWNFSTAKILESGTSSRQFSTGYTENSSGYGHSLGSRSTTFSSSKSPKTFLIFHTKVTFCKFCKLGTMCPTYSHFKQKLYFLTKFLDFGSVRSPAVQLARNGWFF